MARTLKGKKGGGGEKLMGGVLRERMNVYYKSVCAPLGSGTKSVNSAFLCQRVHACI